MDALTEGMVRLVGAQYVAFELLGRYLNPGTYDPWLPDSSIAARRFWKDRENYPLQDIRNYRNNLVHGNPGIPRLINYQGKLADTGGPVEGSVSIVFSIYNVATGARPSGVKPTLM